MIKIVAIVVVSFAAGVPAGYLFAISTGGVEQANKSRHDFFKAAPEADLQDAQEMKPRW